MSHRHSALAALAPLTATVTALAVLPAWSDAWSAESSGAASAMGSQTASSPARAGATLPADTGARLSTWLLSQPADASRDRSALMWLVADEIPRQATLRLSLRDDLERASNRHHATGQAARRLLDWLVALPVTGRVPLEHTDPRWLEVNPLHDPVLRPGHSIQLPARSSTVTVVTDRGERCAVRHRAGMTARDYVTACSGIGIAGDTEGRRSAGTPATDSADAIDWVWVAQPDGRIQRNGIALWNGTTQDEPAPGAWIWAPARTSDWNERLSERLIAFLATQGPAPDPVASADEQSLAQRSGGAGATAATGTALPTREAQPVARASPAPRSLEVSASDWGGTGLLQTPSARMHDSGYFGFTASHVKPYTHGNVTLQPLPWMEVAFRYSDISNVLYGPAVAGTQSYKDKSIDLKLRAMQESARLPEVAIGFHDLTGTGLFSGEYVVASKRTGPLDWSAGLGWGYMAGRGDLGNPFSVLGSGFEQRKLDVGQGGKFNPSAYFHGRTALFGGVEYQSPWAPLRVKLEYDANNYQHEPFGNTYRQRSPFNGGIVYRASPFADFSLGVERGNTLMLGLTLQTQVDRLSMPKLGEAPRLPVAPRPASPSGSAPMAAEPIRAVPGQQTLIQQTLFEQTQWRATRIERVGREMRVTFADAEANYLRERVDRAVSVLHRDAPGDIDRFVLIHRQRGVPMARHVIERDAWVREQTEPQPPRAQRMTVRAERAERADGTGQPDTALPAPAALAPPGPAPSAASSATGSSALPDRIFEAPPDRFESGLGIGLQDNLGGPDAFLLYQVAAVERWKFRFSDDLWLQGVLNLGLIDNYNRFKYDAPSDLPRVRTYLREYLTTSRLTMPSLQLTRVGELAPDHYYSLYGGYLESMFGGVGGEWLYRPFASRVAFGVDLNVVEQRDFRQDLGFGRAGDQSGYRVATGHATLYWDTGWNGVRAQVSAGRYLAGDVGGTVLLAREFGNGVQMGAYATKTNVSAAQFGEGSFDKGIFVKIPFDAFSTRSSGSFGTFNYHPLTRDGGAKLDRAVALIDVTRLRDSRALQARDPGASTTEPGRSEPDRADPPRPASVDRWLRTRSTDEAWTRVEARPLATETARGAQSGEPSYNADALRAALTDQGFSNIDIVFDTSRTLRASVTRDRIERASMAVGRAARTALRFAPLDTRSVAIDYARRGAPAVSYAFADARLLEDCLEGKQAVTALTASTGVTWHDPGLREADALSGLIELDTPLDPDPAEVSARDALLPETTQVQRVIDDLARAAAKTRDIDALEAGILVGSSVVSAALLDARADRFAARHASARWMKAGIRVGNALPWAGLAGAALLTLDPSDTSRARTATSAVEAGGTGLALSMALKAVVGRERPGDTPGAGTRHFSPFARTGTHDSFPSNHTITAWAVATPFAVEYNAPWLYGVAAISNGARVGSRAHWLSDTVAGSALGYGLGRIFVASGRDTRGRQAADGEPASRSPSLVPQVSVGPDSVAMVWPW